MTDPTPPSRHDPYAAFRIPAYNYYLVGSLIASIGTAGQSVAIGWEMYVRTGDAMALAWVGLLGAIPMLLLTLPAGVMADRYSRRKLMLIGLLGTTLTSIGLALFSAAKGSIGWMYVLLFIDSCFLRIAWPARAALLPMLVPRDIFENAVKWRTSGFQISGMVGPAVGGFLVAWYLPSAYWFSAASTALLMLFVSKLTILQPQIINPSAPGLLGIWRDVAEGSRFVWHNKLLLGAISLDMFAVLFGGAVYLLPIYATDILDVGATGLGYLRAAPAAGAMVTALVLAYLPPMRRAGLTLFVSIGGFGIATIIFGFSTSFWLSMAMLALTGVFDNVSVVVRHTLVQLATPDHMRGRVSAVNAVFIGSSNEIGGFESGLVAKLAGPVFSVVSGGVATIAIVAAWSGLFPRLRKLRTLSTVET